MSSFRRTASGLNNQHLFHNVDTLFLVEGGSHSFSKDEVLAGNFTSESNDILFWQNIISHFRPNISYKVKSVGSKTTLKSICEDIESNAITTIIVAMDNEFDEILNQRINHKNIFYTNGYAWENDVWENHNVVKDIIEELSASNIQENEISSNLSKLHKKIKLAVYADGYQFSKNLSFFPRPKGYLVFVDCEPNDLPSVKSNVIQQHLINKTLNKSTLYKFGKKYLIDIKKHCYGHFYADYSYQLILHYLKNRLDLPGLNKEFIYRMGINKYFRNYFTTSRAFPHYQLQFNRP